MVRLVVCDVVVDRGRYELPSRMLLNCQGRVVGEVKYQRGIVQREIGQDSISEVPVPYGGDDYNWSRAVASIGKYLMPLSRSELAVFSGASVEFAVESDVFVDVYVLACAIGLVRLKTSMDRAMYSYPFDVLVELYRHVMVWVRKGQRIVPSVHQCLILLLSRDVNVENFGMLEHLEFAEVVCKVMTERKDLYPLAVLWLSSVYNEYFESTVKSVYSFELRQMLQMVRVENRDAAFAKWIYSAFFECDLSLIEPYAGEFEFQKPWRLSVDQAKWLFEKTGRIDFQGKSVCDIDAFTLEELESLVPYFVSNPDVCDHIAKRLVESGKSIENCAILKRIAGFVSLEVMMGLVRHEKVSVVMRYMVKWHKAHPEDENYDAIFIVFEKESENPENGYYLLKLLSYNPKLVDRVCEALRTPVFVCSVFEWMIANITTFSISQDALMAIRSHFEFEGRSMDTLVRLLCHFEIYKFPDALIMPIFNESYWSTVELVVHSKRRCSKQLTNALCEAVAHNFWALTCQKVRFLAQFIQFNQLFGYGVKTRYSEDGYFYLASISRRPNWDLIIYNCLSLRMAAKFLLTEAWQFQFPVEPDSFCYNTDFESCQFDEEKWGTPGPICSVDGSLAVLDSEVDRCDMRWFDCPEKTVTTDIAECLSARVVVINQVPENTDAKEVIDAAQSHAELVLVSARVAKAAADWGMHKILDFADDGIDKIDWKNPPPDFPVAKQDLLILEVESMEDVWYQSIPCRVNDVSNIATALEMESSGRVFAAKFVGTNVRIFNFDIHDSDKPSLTSTACQKLKVRSLAWLCEADRSD